MHEWGPVEQMRRACANLRAALLGAALGVFVPSATFAVVHAIRQSGNTEPTALWALAAGGGLYSAKTVWQWGRMTFDDPWKALGFVILLEGVMIASPYEELSLAALGYLLFINATATACLLAGRDVVDQHAAQTAVEHQPRLKSSDAADGFVRRPASHAAAGVSPVHDRALDLVRACSNETRTAHSDLVEGEHGTDLQPVLLAPAYTRALALVSRDGSSSVSISRLKRELRVGWKTATRIVGRLEQEGVIDSRDPKTGLRRALPSDARSLAGE